MNEDSLKGMPPAVNGNETTLELTSRAEGSSEPEPGSGSLSTNLSVRIAAEVGDVVEGEITVPDGPARPADLVPLLRPLVDAVARAAVKREAHGGRRVSCHEGCAACCRLLVVVSTTEARALVNAIESLPQPRRARLRECFDSVRRRLDETGLLDKVSAIASLDPGSRSDLARQYLDQRIDCPFLENERCSIYEQRPLICREHMVTSAAEWCTNADTSRIRRVPLGWKASKAVHTWREEESPDGAVALDLAPEWVAEHPEPPPRRTGPDLLRAIMPQAINATCDNSPRVETSRAHASMKPTTIERSIVPDYTLPDALMVPHGGGRSDDVLTRCAVMAAEHIGVILLSDDPLASRAFIDRQRYPHRFTIVSAELDTPWIRDRAPFAVSTASEYEWVLPKVPGDDRPMDSALFENISAQSLRVCPRFLSGGNLVAGPNGLALSTTQVLVENDCDNARALRDAGHALGIRRWLFFPPFREELSGHADVHVRFLASDLFAVSWSMSREEDRRVAAEIEKVLGEVLPAARSLRIPMRSDGPRYASPVNWVQIDRDLLVPRFDMTPDEDCDSIRATLEGVGFRVHFVHSPTEQFGGSLHCLTASIYSGTTP